MPCTPAFLAHSVLAHLLSSRRWWHCPPMGTWHCRRMLGHVLFSSLGNETPHFTWLPDNASQSNSCSCTNAQQHKAFHKKEKQHQKQELVLRWAPQETGQYTRLAGNYLYILLLMYQTTALQELGLFETLLCALGPWAGLAEQSWVLSPIPRGCRVLLPQTPASLVQWGWCLGASCRQAAFN